MSEDIDISRSFEPIRKIKVGNDIKDCFVYVVGNSMSVPVTGFTDRVNIKVTDIVLDQFALLEKNTFIYDVYISFKDGEPFKWMSFPMQSIASIEYDITNKITV
jgi:hypothetical protein